MKSKDTGRRSSRSNDLRRRDFLRLGAAVTARLVASPVIAKANSPHERILRFQNTHTGEAVSTVYWADGNYVDDGLASIDSVLRDHRTDEIYSMDRQLLDLLFLLKSKTDSRKTYEVISGYRSPATNEALRNKSSGVAKRSYHMRGMAIDIRLPGYDLKQLQLAALDLKAGGVGYYPRSGFIHVDVGPARSW